MELIPLLLKDGPTQSDVHVDGVIGAIDIKGNPCPLCGEHDCECEIGTTGLNESGGIVLEKAGDKPGHEFHGNQYLRVGDPPKSGRSANYVTGKPERGISVYPLDASGKPYVPNDWDENDVADFHARLVSDDPKHIVTGQEVGKGQGGEPLLQSVNKVREYDPAEHFDADDLEHWQRRYMQKTAITVAGLCVKAADTGRVLLLKRDHSDLTDPERGCYEFPGGHLHSGEDPFDGARREWSEEVGIALPPGILLTSWTSGIYEGFVYLTPSEMIDPASWHRVDNPDHPTGDIVESVIWADPADARHWPDLRSELRGADHVWDLIANARVALIPVTCSMEHARARLIPIVKEWDSEKHPRGQPENAGEFASGGGVPSSGSGAPKARLSIRSSVYRDKPGFTITGHDTHGRKVSVFTETRSSAEHIRDKIKHDEDTTVEDFNPQPPPPLAKPVEGAQPNMAKPIPVTPPPAVDKPVHEPLLPTSNLTPEVQRQKYDTLMRGTTAGANETKFSISNPDSQKLKAAVVSAVAKEMGTKFDEQLRLQPFANAPSNSNSAAYVFGSNLPATAEGPTHEAATIGEALNANNYVVRNGGSGSASILGGQPPKSLGLKATGSVTSDDGNTWAMADTPEAAQLIREAQVAGLIHQWAATSNDHDPVSLAIQLAAEKEFGLSDTAPWQAGAIGVNGAAQKEFDSNGKLYQGFLRAQYNVTQRALKAAGITELTVHRGQAAVSLGEKGFVSKGVSGEMSVALRPLASFSVEHDIAQEFGERAAGKGNASNEKKVTPALIYSISVPASRIFSTPASGVGCLGEGEVVVLGGTDKVHAEPITSSIPTLGDVNAMTPQQIADFNA